MTRKQRPLADRLTERLIRNEDGCLVWTGAVSREGYGRINRGARGEGMARVHRVAYELWVGPIPDGLVLDHLCRNRACCEPSHLEAVTDRTNILRGESSSARAHRLGVCIRGLHPLPSGGRCRACATEQTRRYRAER